MYGVMLLVIDMYSVMLLVIDMYSVMLLVIDIRIDGALRERMLVSSYR